MARGRCSVCMNPWGAFPELSAAQPPQLGHLCLGGGGTGPGEAWGKGQVPRSPPAWVLWQRPASIRSCQGQGVTWVFLAFVLEALSWDTKGQ